MSEDITINDNCWVGAKSVLCPGVNLKENSIIKVNTTLKKNF